ncbi:hypothetical protein NDU88_004396 [Pleurodeles waltl]|uniref:Uncharacterized protein n=1 Tax=Pleurodeles waltl TaxID=8319 RepID=A0AAV7RJ73_PLEWA|nr:hypothetical protein NDU88_004396 [Pleurodeles waltl]
MVRETRGPSGVLLGLKSAKLKWSNGRGEERWEGLSLHCRVSSGQSGPNEAHGTTRAPTKEEGRSPGVSRLSAVAEEVQRQRVGASVSVFRDVGTLQVGEPRPLDKSWPTVRQSVLLPLLLHPTVPGTLNEGRGGKGHPPREPSHRYSRRPGGGGATRGSRAGPAEHGRPRLPALP